MTKPWITCPGCGWNYELHGDTHMSTRFKCPRSRNTVAPHDRGIMGAISDYVPHVASLSAVVAEAQQEAIKQIMAERELNFGDAVNVYIEQRAWVVDTAGWDAA